MNKYSPILLTVALALAGSCREQDVAVYDPADSLVRFGSTMTSFSLIGNKDAEPVFDINLILAGTECDYDRPVAYEIIDTTFNTAVLGQDFTVEEAVVPAGSLSGHLRIKVKAFSEDEFAKQTTSFRILPNEHFKYIYSGLDVTYVTWSNQFVRPTGEDVFRSWWYFFSQGYSQNYHKILAEFLGEDIQYTSRFASARKNDDLIFKADSWWYASSRALYDMVKKHDQEHPDAPYMHSEDYEYYSSPYLPVGGGKKPDVIPTILSTLLVM